MIDPKRRALQELIRHVNKKRFQDKEMDPSDVLQKMAGKAPPEEPDYDDDDDAEGHDLMGHDDAEHSEDGPESDEHDDYRKAFMKGQRPQSPRGPSLAIMIAQKPEPGMGGRPRKKLR